MNVVYVLYLSWRLKTLLETGMVKGELAKSKRSIWSVFAKCSYVTPSPRFPYRFIVISLILFTIPSPSNPSHQSTSHSACATIWFPSSANQSSVCRALVVRLSSTLVLHLLMGIDEFEIGHNMAFYRNYFFAIIIPDFDKLDCDTYLH